MLLHTFIQIMETHIKDIPPTHERVNSIARIAIYDDMLSSPRVIDISPNTTREYINDIAATVHKYAKDNGGQIPYSIILQVAENFIHSYFSEVVVTVLDGGNTIRFSDQGPGISDKTKALTPGFSSATAEMKKVIHGVGSGLPIVTEYMETLNGRIEIEDNINSGAVVTISLTNSPANAKTSEMTPSPNGGAATVLAPSPNGGGAGEGYNVAKKTTVLAPSSSMGEIVRATLSERGQQILQLFAYENTWGVSAISKELALATSTVHADLKKLEEAGLIAKIGTKRMITDLGKALLDGQL